MAIRVRADGSVMREVRLEVPQALFERLEAEKAKTRRSYNALLMEIVRPVLERLPATRRSN